MEKPNPIREKSYSFSLAVVVFCKDILVQKKQEYILSKQLLRAGTSVGANVEEAVNAPTKKDFANKLSIALKEVYESRFWLFLLRDAKCVTENEIGHLLKQVQEIIALLTSILKTSRVSLS